MTPLTTTQSGPNDKRANPLADAFSDILDLFSGDVKDGTAVATADGLTTGILDDSLGFVAVTSASANNIVTLPVPRPGRFLLVSVGANGCELRTTDPTTIGINGGVGAAAESALAANVCAILYGVSATAWRGFQQTSAGVLTLVEVAAP